MATFERAATTALAILPILAFGSESAAQVKDQKPTPVFVEGSEPSAPDGRIRVGTSPSIEEIPGTLYRLGSPSGSGGRLQISLNLDDFSVANRPVERFAADFISGHVRISTERSSATGVVVLQSGSGPRITIPLSSTQATVPTANDPDATLEVYFAAPVSLVSTAFYVADFVFDVPFAFNDFVNADLTVSGRSIRGAFSH